ncbi:hypothetical protein LTR36_009153 [Oleoguttula mirabilis]|uniref:F-box domain-containing protein n=1 Tax=Oleoguttula mirabilis TaxID=1507867 RepID=A0AAV9J801_9PEZI|nr:hypothetical protein LTR36_009153 [Oleoguttula mirabilis]
MESPVARVLGTTELLEAIFLDVDLQTLLLSQRTSTFFRSTIVGSTRLQRALFFKQDPQGTSSDGSERPRRNPLLHWRRFGRLRIPGLPQKIWKLYVEKGLLVVISKADADWPGLKHSPAGDETASWRRMFLQHSPKEMIGADAYLEGLNIWVFHKGSSHTIGYHKQAKDRALDQKAQSTEAEPGMASPTEKVVATAELLEAILLNLDTKTLLLSQRTCRAFRDTIAGSTQLQRALFFQQSPDADARRVVNPLLRRGDFFDGPRPELVPLHLAIAGARTSVYINNQQRHDGTAAGASWTRMYLHRRFGDGTLTLGGLVQEFVELCGRTGRYLVDTVK